MSHDPAFASGSSRPLPVVKESDGQRQVQGKPAIQIDYALARYGRANGNDWWESDMELKARQTPLTNGPYRSRIHQLRSRRGSHENPAACGVAPPPILPMLAKSMLR